MNGDRTENPRFLSTIIHEMDCDYCGKHFAFSGLKKDYVFKKQYSDDGMLYFCCEDCKRNYVRDRAELMKKRRHKRMEERERKKYGG